MERVKRLQISIISVLAAFVLCIGIFVYMVCNQSRASEKIKGAFGLTLGEQIDCSVVVGKISNYSSYHKFVPIEEKRSPIFDEYHVSTTPKTYKVASIMAVKCYKGLEYKDAVHKVTALRYVLWKKYGMEDHFAWSRTEISQSKRTVSIDITPTYLFSELSDVKISICYFDRDLVRLRDREREELIKEKKLEILEKLAEQLDMRGL